MNTDPNLAEEQRIGVCRVNGLKQDVYTMPPAQGQEILWKRGRKDTARKAAHRSSQQLQQHTQDVYKLKVEKGDEHRIPSLS